ncbi:MAG: glycosyltransferase family 8 protein [Lachnospiraceae bacterium]|nr:glycosyltransferase family 8 protein [Lachnospiraceae bacterium]
MIIPIVFATDEHYIPYCGVAISSLIRNCNDHDIYKIYVLYDKLKEKDIYRLENLSAKNVIINCCCVHDHINNLHVSEYNHLTIASAYRLVIPDILESYDKVVYLDSDIVVNVDIAELYKYDIGENIIGAIHGYYSGIDNNFLYNHITKTLGIRIDDFFNAGILLINCKAFREYKVKDKCFDLLRKRKDLYFMDQCAMNIVCVGKVKFLPIKWNYEWQFLFVLGPKTEKDTIMWETLKEHHSIVHYSGIEKPWDYPDQLLADLFWKYARESIFYEEIMQMSLMKKTRDMLDIVSGFTKNRKIAVYGAGNAGIRYIKKLLTIGIYEIVIWVDQKYKEKENYEFPVSSVDSLYKSQFDQLVIAIENRAISDEVKKMLIDNGVDKEKIIQIR